MLGLARQPVTIGLAAGVLAVLAGITLVVRAQAASSGSQSFRISPGWIGLGVLAGVVLPVQGAINARLRDAMIEPIAVALTSFLIAAATITIVLLILRLTKATPAPRLRGVRTMPWWGWLGGACAAVYVTGTFLLIPAIGAATTIVLTVTGQQLASATIDGRGAFGLARRPISPLRAVGLGLLITGCALVELL